MRGKRKRARLRAEALALSAIIATMNVMPALADTTIPEIGIEASESNEGLIEIEAETEGLETETELEGLEAETELENETETKEIGNEIEEDESETETKEAKIDIERETESTEGENNTNIEESTESETDIEKEIKTEESETEENAGIQLLSVEAEKITVTYFVDSANKGNEEIEKGTTPDLSDGRAGEREGYRFKGWYLEPEFINRVTESSTFDTDTNLYGGWERREDKVFITPRSDKYPIDAYIVIDKGGTLAGHNVFDIFHRHDRYMPEGWYLEPEFINGADGVVFNEDTDIYVKWDELVYIFYHLNDGTNSVDEEFLVKGNEHGSFFPDRQREGYIFGGWYLEAECENSAPSHHEPLNGDLHLYAKWTAIEGTEIRYYMNDGTDTLYKTRELKGNELKSAVASERPAREKYWFGGWYKDKGCIESFYTSPMDEGIVYDEDGDGVIELYAGWTEVVNFVLHMNDGTDTKYEEGEQIKGSWATLTNRIPTREGYKFVGWSTNTEGTDTLFEKVYLGGDTDLYAKWEQKDERYIEVTYHMNDGTDRIYKTEEILKGSLPQSYGLPSNGNYIHKGWYTDPECTNEFLAYKYPDGFMSDIDLYAKWEEEKIITVTYHLNDGSENDVYKTDERYVQKEYQPNLPLPTRENYKFTGWYTEPQCTSKVNGNISLTESKDLYAGWIADGEKPDKIIVTYDMSYDMVFSIFKVDEIDKGGTIDLSEKPKVLGRDFIGWYKDKGFTEQVDETTVLTEDTYLYAKYRKEYMIKFYMNDGTENLFKTAYIPEGENLKTAGQPNREGYTFTGWYKEAECKNKVDSINKDGSLYAGWRKNGTDDDKKEKVTITYYTDKDTVYKTEEIEKNTIPSFYTDTPTRDNHRFIGWYKDPEGTQLVDVNEPVGEDTNYYAKWQEIKENINVTFYRNDDTYVIWAFMSANKGSHPDLSSISIPVRYGYEFKGWYMEPECINEASEDLVMNQNTDFYAKWEAKEEDDKKDKVTITYYTDKDTVYKTEEVDKSKVPTLSDKPSKDGYEFTGWYLDSDCTMKFTGALEGDTDLYAGWKKKDNNNSGSSNSSSSNSGGGNSSKTETILEYDWYLDTDGRWYLLPRDRWGVLSEGKKGWYYEAMDKKWYYFDLADGHMLTGWNFINERWYYFTEANGGQTYFGDNSKGWKYTPISEVRPYGSMYENETTPDGYFVDENGVLN